METDDVMFQDLESFGKRKVSQNGYGKVLNFIWEIPKYRKIDITLFILLLVT